MGSDETFTSGKVSSDPTFADTVHFLSKYLRARREIGLLVDIVLALATVFLLLPPLLMKLEQKSGDAERAS